jgi:predicted transcriptional regulator
MAVSLRLPPEVSRRIARLVAGGDTSAHAFMLQAIAEKLEAEEARAAFQAEARQRLEGMLASGKGILAEEVFGYLHARVEGQQVRRPRARKPR